MASVLAGIWGRKRILPNNRVGQLDSNILDDELFEILKSQIWEGSKLIQSSWKDRYASELGLILKALLWKVTVWDNSATYGGLLQNIRLVDARSNSKFLKSPSKSQKLVYGFLAIFGQYIFREFMNKLESTDSEQESESRIKRLSVASLRKLESLYSFLDLANFVAFLYNGQYPSLVFRLCRLRMSASSRSMSREVSFEFLNRQLVWNEFTNFLLFLLPLLHLPKLKRRAGKLIERLKRGSSTAPQPQVGPLAFLPERTCAICYFQDNNVSSVSTVQSVSDMSSTGPGRNDITNPYETVECHHVYCYVCLVTQIQEQEGQGWPCLRCGSLVNHAKSFRS
ncbi:Pex12 amino terminal region-domain-containing protein [Lipomyces oligophaga]|uniref:Pex12 amino terminal region-domain-containing protein n=1 Tax=Lipomyces oligophaga TaxID=45792 RepID=UPI0034CFA7BE